MDLRLPVPIKMAYENLQDEILHEIGVPPRYTFDIPDEINGRIQRITDLNARQTIAKEMEPFIQIGGQYIVRDTLLEMAKKAVSRNTIKQETDIFELTPEQLLEISHCLHSSDSSHM